MKLIDTTEAAKLLGVGRSTVSRLRRSGLLPYRMLGRKIRFNKADVLAVKAMRARGYKTRNLRNELNRLRYQVEGHERLIKTLLITLGIPDNRKIITDKDLHGIYKRIQVPLSHVTLENAREWVETAQCLREPEFSRMAVISGDPHPWRSAVDYTWAIVRDLENRRDYPRNPEAFQLVQLLLKVYEGIRATALILLESQPEGASAMERFEEMTADPDADGIDPDEMLRNMKHGHMTPEDREWLLDVVKRMANTN